MATITGTAGNDVLSGGGTDDVIFGAGGNDTAIGNAGDDSIYGQDGDDSLFGDTTDIGGYYGTVGDDFIDGGAGSDLIRGGFGTDTLVGGAGNDTLNGEPGADIFVLDQAQLTAQADFFADFDRDTGDRLDLGRLGIAEFATLQALTSVANGFTTIRARFNGTDQLTQFAAVDLVAADVILSDDIAPDALTGTADADDLFGGGGDDTLIGGGGTDRLFGETGADALYGDYDGDTLFGGAGGDRLDGGFDDDTLDGGAGTDTLIGGTGGDRLTGGAGADIFVVDPIADYGYSDVILDFSRAQGDRLDLQALGISEFATFQRFVSNVSGGIFVDFLKNSGTRRFQVNGVTAGELTAADVILDTAVVNDTITGGSGNDDIFGGLGDDLLQGYFGADQLFGEGGDDRLYGETQFASYGTYSDFLDGGAGNDTLGGNDGNDTLLGGAGDDVLRGEGDADSLSGGAGNDSLSGGDDNDSLDGGAGNDLLAGDQGNDSLTGGSGADQFFSGGFTVQTNTATDFSQGQGDRVNVTRLGIADFATVVELLDDVAGGVTLSNRFAADVNVLLLQNLASRDLLTAADFVFSTTVSDDTVTGSNLGDDLFGGLGDDTLIGQYGADSLFGEGGNDILIGGYDGVGYANDLGDFLSGGAGDDTLDGGSGADTLVGGDGADTFVLDPFGTLPSGSPATYDGDVVADFALDGDRLDVSRLGISEFQTLLAVLRPDYTGDTVLGLRFNGIDSQATILGLVNPQALAPINVVLDTTVANDFLDGTYNGDDLFGGLGNDTLAGGAGDDRLFGEQGDDVLFGSDQSALGGYGSDLLDGGSGNDRLTTGAFRDTLYGRSGDDTLVAGNGNDILAGGEGADTLTGGAGFDIFIVDPAFDNYGRFSGPQTEIVTDFQLDQLDPGEGDGVDVSRLGISEFSTVQALLLDLNGPGNGPVHFQFLTDGDLQSVVFSNVTTADQFTAADFILNSDTTARFVVGFYGDDHVFGGGGDDSLFGSGGDDTVFGEGGDDDIFGDLIDGGGVDGGYDILDGGAGDDYINGDGGADLIRGGTGSDTLLGGEQGDYVGGGDGDDTVVGGGANDTLVGGDGTDTAVFQGRAADFVVSTYGGQTFVQDQNAADGNLGLDGLDGFEFIQFDDALIDLNAAPVTAVGDYATVGEDADATAIDVLANDIGAGLTLADATSAGPGQVSVVGNQVVFDPLGDFQSLQVGEIATVTVTYVVTDGTTSDTGLLEITVQGANDAPVAALDSRSVFEDIATLSIAVLANDSDVDGDTLSLVSVTQPALGSVAISGNSVVFSTNGAFQGLDAGETSLQTFTYVVSDGTVSRTGTVRVTVTGGNDAPVAVADAATVSENTASVTINALANDSDVDGEGLTLTALTQPALGSAAIVGGQIVFTTGAAFQGLDSGETSVQTLTYTVSDGTATDSATVTITVTGANDAPVAVNDTASLSENTASVTINALANDNDIDGETLTLAALTQPSLGSAAIVAGQIVFTTGAAFQGLDSGETSVQTFTYTVSDGLATDTATVRVTVTGLNDAPVAVNDTATVSENTASVTINALANDSDIDGETLTLTALTQPTLGSAAIVAGQIVFTTGAAFQGLDSGETSIQTFTYTVSDGTATDTATVTVTVTGANDAPVAVNDTASLSENTASVIVDVLANDIDVDGEAVFLASSTLATRGSVAIVAGRLVFSTDGDFDDLDSGETATEVLTYTITDGLATDTATLTVTVTGLNDRPVAADDAETVDENAALFLNVLLNDTDVDDALTITALTQPALGAVAIGQFGGGGGVPPTQVITFDTGGAFDFLGAGETSVQTFTYTVSDGTATDTATATITVTGTNDAPVAVNDTAATDFETAVTIDVIANDSDAEGDPVRIAAFGQGANGTVAQVRSALIYTPDAGFSGTDRFSVRISDGQGGSDIATVTVTVRPRDNTAPVATADTATTAEDTAITIPVLANDVDAEGDPITITAIGPAAHGIVVQAGGVLRYRPDADFTGTDRFTYTVSDGTASDTATVTVTVTAVNDAPVPADDAATVAEDGTVLIRVLANDLDVDGDALTITAVGAATNGTATRFGSLIRYTPDAQFSGTDAFTYTVRDAAGVTRTATVAVTVTPVNDAPVARADTALVEFGTPSEPIAVLANDLDIDGGVLRLLSFGQGDGGTVTRAPGNTLIYTPDAGFSGSDTIAYVVSDGRGGTATGTVAVTVAPPPNRAPVAIADAFTTDRATAFTTGSVLANDSDPDDDAISVVGVFAIGALGTLTDNGDGTFDYDPGEAFEFLGRGQTAIERFTYLVSDGTDITPGSLTITVTGVNAAPQAADDTATLAEDAGPTLIDVTANDADTDGDPLGILAFDASPFGTLTLVDGRLALDLGQSAQALDDGDTREFTIGYIVSDGLATDTATLTVTVTGANDAPVAVDDTLTLGENVDAATLNLLANDSDIDGDTLQLIGISTPARGTAAFSNDGTLAFRVGDDFDDLGAGQTTTVLIDYTLFDGTATATGTAIITVTGANDAPVAVDDAASVDAGDGTITLDVLANDSDIDGDALTLTAVSGPARIEGNRLRFDFGDSFADLAQGDSTTIAFDYTVSDGRTTAAATATVTVTGANDAPVAVDDAASVDAGDGTITLDVLANDSDIDGDALTLTAVSDGARIVGNELRFDFGDAFDDLAQGEAATIVVDYTVSDGRTTATATATVTIIGDRAPPTLVIGTQGDDNLTGTTGDDILDPLGGALDRVFGGAGRDIFDFAGSTANGEREKRVVRDYAAEDRIDLGVANLSGVIELDDRVVLFLDRDRDAMVVFGVSTVDEISFLFSD